MARQLYDYWFVQFDFPDENGRPYKSSGGKMKWNERLKREIPIGWKVVSVNEIANSVRGVTYKKEDLVDKNEGILVLRGNNIQDNKLIYDSNVSYVPTKLVSEEQHIKTKDIIMTMSSGSKEHIGKCVMFQDDSDETYGAFLTKFSAFPKCKYLLYQLFNSLYFKEAIKSFAIGTGINNLTNSTFDNIYTVLPSDIVLSRFDEIEGYIYKGIGLLWSNSMKLTKLRDELLPLLMNGQATVNYHLSFGILFVYLFLYS
uniref:restriction endonuclease subunit S n=1 Tax=Prevotella sp. TaxID=59823 RepID=UPI0040287CD1